MWTAENQHWRFNHLALQARWNIACPADGFTNIELSAHPLSELRVLQCRNSTSAGEPEDFLVDHYVREDDLVATYVQAPRRANRKQVYLRRSGFLFSESLAGVEMVFSMQTDRLDGDPRLQIRSELPTRKMHALVNHPSPSWAKIELPPDALDLPADHFCGAFAAELPCSGILYVQILDPSDFLGGRLVKLSEGSHLYALSLPVFGAGLEKGVIRRGRVTGLFVTGNDSLDCALRFYQWYRESAPPLTT